MPDLEVREALGRKMGPGRGSAPDASTSDARQSWPDCMPDMMVSSHTGFSHGGRRHSHPSACVPTLHGVSGSGVPAPGGGDGDENLDVLYVTETVKVPQPVPGSWLTNARACGREHCRAVPVQDDGVRAEPGYGRRTAPRREQLAQAPGDCTHLRGDDDLEPARNSEARRAVVLMRVLTAGVVGGLRQ